ncbi:MAG TPA: hypothetical protein VKU00_15430 [Chthonomonadaceae bacterium]|nr:hypothetical protein [Chthonomonadaceae bacterium]
MHCPRCGYHLGPFETSCPKCAHLAQTHPSQAQPPAPSGHVGNAALPPAYKVCPACQQPAVLTMERCRRCGNPFPPQPYATPPLPPVGYGAPSASIAPQSEYASQEYSNALRSRRANAALYGVCALFLLLFAIGVLALSSQRRQGGGSGIFLVGSGPSNDNSSPFPAIDEQQLASRLTHAGATTGGEVEVSLAWNTLTDLDIQVRDPSGELISASHPRSQSGGIQDVDANPTPTTLEGSMLAAEGKNPGPENVLPVSEELVDLEDKIGMPSDFGGSGLPGFEDKAPPRYTRKPVEHIYFAHASKGIYTVYAHCYMWREPNSTPLPYTVQIRSHGKAMITTTGTIGPESYITYNAAPIQVCQFEMR